MSDQLHKYYIDAVILTAALAPALPVQMKCAKRDCVIFIRSCYFYLLQYCNQLKIACGKQTATL